VEKKKAEMDSYTPCNALAHKLSFGLQEIGFLEVRELLAHFSEWLLHLVGIRESARDDNQRRKVSLEAAAEIEVSEGS